MDFNWYIKNAYKYYLKYREISTFINFYMVNDYKKYLIKELG